MSTRVLPFISTLFVATLAMGLAACQSDLDGKARARVQDPAPATAETVRAATAVRTLPLDPEASKIEFVGAKVTGDHRGTFSDVSGKVELSGEHEVSGLEVVVKTQSVSVEPDKLEQHLRSADFFDVEKYPHSKFTLTAMTPSAGDGITHTIEGNLELHGVTKRISFPATVTWAQDGVSAKASFKIDRKQFGIVYAGMADDLIKDDVLLEMTLAFEGHESPRT